MSKRRSGRSQGIPAAKRARSQWSRTRFGEMVEAAGFILGGKDENQIGVEPAKFQQKLSYAFRNPSNLDTVVGEFARGFSEYINDPVRFRMSLTATKIREGANVMSRFGGLDSLIHLLLGVTAIQPKVARILLEKLPEYIDDEGMKRLGAGEYQQMPRLILNQFRWLNQIVNGKELCSNLLQIVDGAPADIQREIVTALPEILDDPQHDDAAQQLKSLLQNKANLTSAILDALSNLNVANTTAEEVLEVALDKTSSADISDLPTIIKFIVQYISPRNAQDVISELREKLELDFSPLRVNHVSSTPLETQSAARKQSAETSDHFVVFDTIRSSICFQKPVADGWTKAIEAVTEPQDHSPLDVFVLFILYSLPARRKSIETIFSSKIKSGSFSEDIMDQVFGVHAGALRDFFPTILSLCEHLLCSSSPSVSSFAASLYHHLFTTFDVFCQQEVIGALIAHIGNGIRSEVDHALDIILSLLEHNFKSMHRFSVFIKSVLDFVEQLTVPQIRKLYHALSTLSFQAAEEATSMQDEMHTIIRKQLSHSEAKYRHMGVIGAVMVIRQLAESSAAFDMNRTVASQQNSTSIGLTPARRRKADSTLEDVLKSCESSPECTIIFCDEMSSVAKSLDHSFLEDLSEKITTLFQDTYLVEISDPLPNLPGLPLEFSHGLDNTEEGTIALNLFPMVAASPERLRAMAAHFHLLCVLTMTQHNNLEEVDALLGCPIVMCKAEKLNKDVFEDMPLSRRQDICLSLFHCLNWFGELVCAFAHEADPDMKGKILIRLTNVTEMQNQFEICMNATPGFWPPSVVAAPEETLHSKVKKGKGGKGDVTLASITAAATQIDKDTTSVDKAASSSNAPAVPIDKLTPFFRELDLRVFAVLHYGVLSRTILDSEQMTKERDELRLRPPQLAFLLQDLSSKLSSTFSLFAGKGRRKSKDATDLFTVAELISTMTYLIPPLCKNLEDIVEYFQSQIADNDGILDADSSDPDYPHHVFCLHLLLKCLATFFGWSSLSDHLYADSLRQSLTSVAARLPSSSSSSQLGNTSLPQLAKKSCEYFQRFGEFLPTLTCAHSLAKLLVAVCKTCKADHHHHSVSAGLGDLLKRPWRTAESTKLRSEALEYLLKYYFEWASDPLAVIESLVGDAVVELMGDEARDTSQKYPTLTEATLSTYYRSMMSSVVHELKAIPAPKRGNPPTDEQLDDRLQHLAISTKVLFLLINLVKSFDRRPMLNAALKYGKAYMEAFLKSGMPVLDLLLRPRKEDVASVIKTLQTSTRCLQHFCAHSKAVKDTNLVNHVPQLKKTLETLLFKVKEILDHNQCSEAYWIGNLKNRDIQGHEILSQISERSDGEEEEGEGESEGEEGAMEEEMELEDNRSITNSTSTDRKSRDEDIDTDSTTS